MELRNAGLFGQYSAEVFRLWGHPHTKKPEEEQNEVVARDVTKYF